MSVPFATFGPGILICTRTDLTPATPVNVGFAQEFSIDFSGNTKQLYGQNQLPLVAARSTIKASGKLKAATLSGIALNNLFWGQTLSTATGLVFNNGSTFTLSTASATQTVGSSLYDADLGVIFVNSGLPGRRVSTGNETSSGLYSVIATSTTTTATYTFSAADTTALTAASTNPIKITYTQTTSSPTGQSLLISNQLIGTSPTFQLDYYTNLNQPTTKPFIVRLYSAIAAKYAWAFKLEDFNMPEVDFDLFVNASGNLMTQTFPEIA